MRVINQLIIHCSATPPSMDVGVGKIREWHMAKGWADVGYHRIIKRDGTIEQGRDDETVGAHAKGHNNDSIGICLVGGVNEDGHPDCNFTRHQWVTLADEILLLSIEHNGPSVHGHREYSSKACPCFDVQAWWDEIGG